MVRCPACGQRFRGRPAPCADPFHDIAAPARPANLQVELPSGYDTVRLLATAAMATVVLAQRKVDGAVVVLKLATPTTIAADRLRREGEMLRQIGAPHVPSVVDEGLIAGGSAWLALEHIGGPTLAARMTETAPAQLATQAVALGLQLARALAAVHARGIVHRDVKPENILLLPARAVLIDFGVATREADAARTAGATPGTPEYMAPEQCAGASIDPRGDLYALGVILYELVSGRPPFHGGSAADVIDGHLRRRPAALRTLAAVPDSLDQLVMALLAKQPEERPADADKVADQLARLLRAPTAELVHTEAVVSVTPQEPEPERHKMVALVFAEARSVATLQARAAAMGATIAFARRGRVALLFDDNVMPVRRALAAGEILVATGAAERIIVDVERVRYVDRPGAKAVAQSAAFVDDDRYPGADGLPLVLSERAAEALGLSNVTPVPGRAGYVTAAETARGATLSTGDEESKLVGRDALLREIFGQAAAAITDGIPTITTVIAEPGMGKSHLATALRGRLADLAHAENIRLSAREPLGLEPGALVAELVTWALDLARGATADEGRIALRRGLGARANELEPPLALALGWLAADATEIARLAPAPGALQVLASQGLAELLLSRARVRPLLILLDDAHWADTVSLAALQLTTAEEERAPIWLGLLARPSFDDGHRAWGARAARHRRITLGPLDKASAHELCRDLLRPAEHVADDVVAALVERAQAIPLFLVDLVRSLKRDGAIRQQGSGGAHYVALDELHVIGDSPLVGWLAEHEVHALPPDLAAHAQLASLLEANLAPDDLAGVLEEVDQQGLGEVFPLDPRAATEALVARGLLVRRRNGLVAFRHALVRDAIARAVPDRLRVPLHRAAAVYCRRRMTTARGEHSLTWRARLAHHAAGSGEHDEAARLFLVLAEDSRTRHAYWDAESHYSRALALGLEHDDQGTYRARRGRGIMRHRTGRYRDALEDFATATQRAERLGDHVAALESILDESEARDWMQDYVGARELVYRARDTLPDDAPLPLRARVHMGLGRTEARSGSVVTAREQLERAVAMASELGDDGYETLVISLIMLQPTLLALGRHDDAEATLRRGLELATARSDRLHLAALLQNKTYSDLGRGAFAEALEDALASRRASRELGATAAELYAESVIAEMLYAHGDYEQSVQYADRALALAASLPGGAPAAPMLRRGRIALAMGDLEQARRVTTELLSMQERLRTEGTEMFMAPEQLLLRMIDLATRAATDEEWSALEDDTRQLDFQTDPLEVMEMRARWLVAHGERAKAREKLEGARRLATGFCAHMLPRLTRILDSID